MLIAYGLGENVQPQQLFNWINEQLMDHPNRSQRVEAPNLEVEATTETDEPKPLPENSVIVIHPEEEWFSRLITTTNKLFKDFLYFLFLEI